MCENMENMSFMRTSWGKKQAGRSSGAAGKTALVLLSFVVSAQASTEYVTNGSFSTLTNGANLQFNTDQTGADYTVPTGWTSSNTAGDAYNFIFASGAAETGATGADGVVALWGSTNGGADVIPASSPDGGNFLAADGDFQTGAVSQNITGLTKGNEYSVSFYWAASQQSCCTGATVQYWAVSLGSETQNTPSYDLPTKSFSGWMSQTFYFTADGTSDLLSFLAVGNVQLPPFLLLDGVTMFAVPEPSTGALLMMAAAFMGLVAIARKRHREARAGRAVR